MSAFLLLVSAFCVVFTLGFQSMNVRDGRYLAAALTSFLIGVSQVALYKLMPSSESPLEVAAFLAGGPLGIVSAMWAHKRIFKKKHGS